MFLFLDFGGLFNFLDSLALLLLFEETNVFRVVQP